MTRRRWIALSCIAALALAAGCGEDEPERYEIPLRVDVRAWDDNSLTAGVKVVVMDLEDNRPVAGPLVSDGRSTLDFGVLSGGRLALLAFGGAPWDIRALPDLGSAPVTGLSASTAPAPGPERVLVAPRPQPGTTPSLAGTVVDADSGQPLDRVLISLNPYAEGYQGDTTPSDDVTGPDGAFQVWDIPLLQEEYAGPVVQAVPLRLSRDGYRPLSYRYSSRYGDTDLDITGLVIPLTRIAEADSGSLSGRVLLLGEPVAGVRVALGLGAQLPGLLPESAPDGKAAAGVVGRTAVTDADGRFTIGGLPAAAYVPHPGFLIGDSVYYPDQTANRAYTVTPGTPAVTDDLLVVHEIMPWWGNGGAYTAGAVDIRISWSPVPDAATYSIYLGGLEVPDTETNKLVVPDSRDLPPGDYPWRIQAQNADGAPIGIMQTYAWFRIVP